MESKNINGKVQRGEIYLYDFGNNGGSIQNGVRPALVVQCDKLYPRKWTRDFDPWPRSADTHLTLSLIHI